ncbi:K(+)/H(+) antiporter NhaP2 [bioreactor metagenome]|uniref:K(+)/H(+) antiporter NhaP2 n=1 Tax=bioreactor metagenome TaxID=1076179 RepID=A0A645JIS4_9ZZZZ
MELYYALTILAFLILACACASKISSWINLPVLVVFLAIGMLAGEQGIGKIQFSDIYDYKKMREGK